MYISKYDIQLPPLPCSLPGVSKVNIMNVLTCANVPLLSIYSIFYFSLPLHSSHSLSDRLSSGAASAGIPHAGAEKPEDSGWHHSACACVSVYQSSSYVCEWSHHVSVFVYEYIDCERVHTNVSDMHRLRIKNIVERLCFQLEFDVRVFLCCKDSNVLAGGAQHFHQIKHSHL